MKRAFSAWAICLSISWGVAPGYDDLAPVALFSELQFIHRFESPAVASHPLGRRFPQIFVSPESANGSGNLWTTSRSGIESRPGDERGCYIERHRTWSH